MLTAIAKISLVYEKIGKNPLTKSCRIDTITAVDLKNRGRPLSTSLSQKKTRALSLKALLALTSDLQGKFLIS